MVKRHTCQQNVKDNTVSFNLLWEVNLRGSKTAAHWSNHKHHYLYSSKVVKQNENIAAPKHLVDSQKKV